LSPASGFGFEAFAHPKSDPANGKLLQADARLAPEDGFTFTLYNRTGTAHFVMLLARDAQGQVHWFHPPYRTEKEDPASVPLAAAPQVAQLDEGVTAENVAPGELFLYALFSDAPLHVSQVEAALSKDPSGLEKLPGVQVQRMRLVVVRGTP
jgi:hypothetical protein